jgi:hypothetical protein
MHALQFHAGPRALARIRAEGLQARDVAVIPAAAGGPKGLIFQALDQWLFGDWLPTAPRERILIGASIGAWRMAAACQRDPVAAFARLGQAYAGQRYVSTKPSQADIDVVVRRLVRDFVQGHEDDILRHPHYRLHVVAARGRGPLAAPAHRRAELTGFIVAALRNATGRARLRHVLERVVLADARASTAWLQSGFDTFTTHVAPLTAASLQAALLASGTLPLLMKAVTGIAGAPHGQYWDGGLVDYHLVLPYSQATGPNDIVLYPHFDEHVVPGWFDKSMPWRRAARGPQRVWLDNMLIVSPTPAFLATLPRAKLPDRSDFQHYGLDHDARVRAWGHAMGEGGRLRDALAAFVANPDAVQVLPL